MSKQLVIATHHPKRKMVSKLVKSKHVYKYAQRMTRKGYLNITIINLEK